MRKILTTITTSILALSALFSFIGCDNIKHNAVVVDQGITYKTEWLDANRTYGVYYKNPLYDPDDEQSEPALTDTTSPKYRTHVINEQTALDEIFVEFPEIDFEKEMVVVYCFTTIYNRERVLETVELGEDNILRIEFKSKNNHGRGDASMPGQGVLTVKMDHLDMTDIQITYNGQ